MVGQFPDREVTAVFELHTFSSLNKAFLPQYGAAMDAADKAVVFFDPDVVAHNLRGQSLNRKWSVIKCLLGAWTTTRRMHDNDGILPCAFLCPCQEDSWMHYVRCPGLWQLVCDKLRLEHIVDHKTRFQFFCTVKLGFLC